MTQHARGPASEAVRSVAEACRNWLSDPFHVGLALASGMLGAALIEPVPGQSTDLKRISVGIIRDNFRASWSSPRKRPVDWRANGIISEFGFAELTAVGLTVFGEGGEAAGPLAAVPRRQILRAQRMALAFRLPESVALRWEDVGREFSIEWHLMLVMPSAQWSHEKWRILWTGSNSWAVKGSPSRSTFADLSANRTETLMQEDIARRIADLGLKIGG